MMQMLKNTPRVLQNVGSSIVSKPGFFRDQSLILASAALVVSRIAVANISAIKAQGTPEGPFRYRESIRTDMREIGGFCLGFGVLRAFQAFTKKALRKGLDITVPELNDGYGFKKIWKDLKAKTTPAAFDPKLAYSTEPYMAGKELNGLAKSVAKVFDAPLLKAIKAKTVAGLKTEGLPEAAATLAKNKAFVVNGVYKVAPILLSSIPSVALAGYFLERMTRDHSERIVDSVSARLGGKAKTIAATPPSSLVSATGPQMALNPGMPQFGRLTTPTMNSYWVGNPYSAMGNGLSKPVGRVF